MENIRNGGQPQEYERYGHIPCFPRIQISEANSREGDDVEIEAFLVAPAFGHHLSGCPDEDEQQQVCKGKEETFFVQAAWRPVPFQTAPLDGCDQRSLATKHLLTNKSQEQDSYGDAEDGVHYAHDLTNEGDWDQVAIT